MRGHLHITTAAVRHLPCTQTLTSLPTYACPSNICIRVHQGPEQSFTLATRCCLGADRTSDTAEAAARNILALRCSQIHASDLVLMLKPRPVCADASDVSGATSLPHKRMLSCVHVAVKKGWLRRGSGRLWWTTCGGPHSKFRGGVMVDCVCVVQALACASCICLSRTTGWHSLSLTYDR